MPNEIKIGKLTLKRSLLALLVCYLTLAGCVVLPIKDTGYINQCEISTDRKYLKVVDIAKGSNSYYSISGIILLPITGVVSGVYVGVNNIYHLGEEKIRCDSAANEAATIT